jgi:Fe-Mn family superoxide dismutase
MEKKLYQLPPLKYGYGDLAPHISEHQLQLHHEKHHQAYVNGANAILNKLDDARNAKTDVDIKAIQKELSFMVAGHLLHFLFWGNLAPAGKGGGGNPEGKLADVLKTEFGSIERFKEEFAKAALTAEGSGWAVLVYCKQLQRPMIMQIEKHNVNVIPMFTILMVLDVWEHAYYLDYENNRGKFIENFWNIVNWQEINSRLEKLLG